MNSFAYVQQMSLILGGPFEVPNYGQNSTLETIGETHKSKENQLKCDPCIGCIKPSIGHN